MTWPAGAWLTAVATSAHNFSKAPRIWATKSCADSWGCVSIAAVTPQVRKCATASSAVPALLRTLSPSRMICHTPLVGSGILCLLTQSFPARMGQGIIHLSASWWSTAEDLTAADSLYRHVLGTGDPSESLVTPSRAVEYGQRRFSNGGPRV